GRPLTSGSTPWSRRSPASAPPPAARASRSARHATTWPAAPARGHDTAAGDAHIDQFWVPRSPFIHAFELGGVAWAGAAARAKSGSPLIAGILGWLPWIARSWDARPRTQDHGSGIWRWRQRHIR